MSDEWTDSFLLDVLRSTDEKYTPSKAVQRAAADRIEEYCTDAACAEEALGRCYMAAGGKIEELPTTGIRDGIEAMAARVMASLGKGDAS